MAYAFRAQTSSGNASGGALAINKPTGTVDGDLIVVVGYLEADTNSWSSIGTGFTEVFNFDNTGLFDIRIWYKWASGEGASWTFTPASNNWRILTCCSYSGGSGSGNAKDTQASAQGDGVLEGSQTAPSITTTANNDLLIFANGNYGGGNPTTTVGAATNLRVSLGGTAIADITIAVAGATGTTRGNGQGTQDYAAGHQGFFLSPAGGPVTGFMTTNSRFWGA